MAIDNRSFLWPIFEFHFQVWKFTINAMLVYDNPQIERREYIRLNVMWGHRRLWWLNLYEPANIRYEYNQLFKKEHQLKARVELVQNFIRDWESKNKTQIPESIKNETKDN